MMYGFVLSVKNEIVKIHPRARINTVSPGWIRTPMAERAMQDPALLYQALASSPLKKVSEPSDITQGTFLHNLRTSNPLFVRFNQVWKHHGNIFRCECRNGRKSIEFSSGLLNVLFQCCQHGT